MKWYQRLLGVGALALTGLTFNPKKAESCSGAVPAGRGYTNVAIADDATAVYYNPAGLIQLERPELDITLGWGINYKAFLCYGKPLNDKNAIGLNFSFKDNDSWLKLGYSRKLSDKLSLGTNLTIENEFSKDILNIDLGILYKPNNKIQLGCLWQGYSSGHDHILRPGITFKPNNKYLISFESYDATDYAHCRHFCSGLEKKVNDKLGLRIGFMTLYFNQGNGITAGASYRKDNLETSIAWNYWKDINCNALIFGLTKKF